MKPSAITWAGTFTGIAEDRYLHRPPLTAISCQQLDRFDRAIGAGDVVGEAVALVFAEGDDLVGQLPGGLDLVPPGEQGRVTAHDVVNQAFISLRGIALVGAEVAGLNFDRHDVLLGRKVLGIDLEIDADIGLDADHQEVGLLVVLVVGKIEDIRQRLELDDDFGTAAGEALTGADIERGAGPAEIVDTELHRHEGLRRRIFRHIWLFAVGGDFFAIDGAAAVLAKDDIIAQGVVCEGGNRLDDLELFLADGLGGQGNRRLHGHHRQDLQDMVLDHVPDRAGMFIIAAA